MDIKRDKSQGQQIVTIEASLVAKIAQQCESLQVLRAWYAHFDRSISQVDKVAAIKGYDLIVDGAINARQIAREFGFVLPDVSNMKWELAPRLGRPVEEF